MNSPFYMQHQCNFFEIYALYNTQVSTILSIIPFHCTPSPMKENSIPFVSFFNSSLMNSLKHNLS